MRKRLLTLGFASILGIAAIVGLRADSSAGNPTFANNILNGSYAFHDEGSLNFTVDDIEELTAQVGVASYDGYGHCSGSQTITYRTPFSSAAGFVCAYKFKCTYSVNPDGTGTSDFHGTLTSGPCADYHVTLAFVLDASGHGARYVYTSAETTPTNIVNSVIGSGELTKQ